MARPKKDVNTPELREVKKRKAKYDRSQAVADADRAAYEESVVDALKQHGYPTLADISEMSIGAMRNIATKRGADNPRAHG